MAQRGAAHRRREQARAAHGRCGASRSRRSRCGASRCGACAVRRIAAACASSAASTAPRSGRGPAIGIRSWPAAAVSGIDAQLDRAGRAGRRSCRRAAGPAPSGPSLSQPPRTRMRSPSRVRPVGHGADGVLARRRRRRGPRAEAVVEHAVRRSASAAARPSGRSWASRRSCVPVMSGRPAPSITMSAGAKPKPACIRPPTTLPPVPKPGRGRRAAVKRATMPTPLAGPVTRKRPSASGGDRGGVVLVVLP